MSKLDDAMLAAINDAEYEQRKEDTPDPDEQRQFIVDNIDNLEKEDLVKIFRSIVINGHKNLIKPQTSTSVAVNLSNVPDVTINSMYMVTAIILARKKSIA